MREETRDGVAWLTETQRVTVTPAGARLVDGVPQGKGEGQRDLRPVGHVVSLNCADPGATSTGPLGPADFLGSLSQASIELWGSERVVEDDGAATTVYYPKVTRGDDLLSPARARRSPACAAPSCSTSSTSCR